MKDEPRSMRLGADTIDLFAYFFGPILDSSFLAVTSKMGWLTESYYQNVIL